MPVNIAGFEEKRTFGVLDLKGLKLILGKPFLYDNDVTVNHRTNVVSWLSQGTRYTVSPIHTESLNTADLNLISHEELMEELQAAPDMRCYCMSIHLSLIHISEPTRPY